MTSRHREHAEQKISKLERYFAGIQRIEASLGHDGHDASVELVMGVRGGKPLVCHSREQDLYAAIDVVLDKAETVLTRHKEKLLSSSRQKGARDAAALPDVPPGDDESSYQEIVDKREF